MMNLLHAVILGIVEGITEFLPISSTGHMILTSRLLGLAQNDFLKSFEIIIQAGAILAVVALYGKMLIANGEILKRVFFAFAPTAILGLFLYKTIKILLGSEAVVIWMLLLGGIIIVAFEWFYREHEQAIQDVERISYRQSLLIGFAQGVSLIPGVSRAAATIVGGMSLDIKRETIVEFSFLLAIPTMLAATGFDLIKNIHLFSLNQAGLLLVGFITSFIVALVSIQTFLRYIKHHTLTIFGIYRIVVALLFLIFLR